MIRFVIPNHQKKINIWKNQPIWEHHRSGTGGWGYVISLFREFHNSSGIVFFGHLESALNAVIDRDFVGVFHNTLSYDNLEMKKKYRPKYDDNSLRSILSSCRWKDSKKHCMGIWVLSEYLAEKIRPLVDVPVSSLYYPTNLNVPEFSIDKFLGNSCKSIIFLGHWMRNYDDFFNLRTFDYQKRFFIDGCTSVDRAVVLNGIKASNDSVVCNYVSNEEFDGFLSKNICFVSAFDASGNTSVVECVARKTPLLINKLPAFVEYLGEEYPFYFENLDEASCKLHDVDLIKSTYEYLCQLPQRKFLHWGHFIESVLSSEVYMAI